MADDFSGVSTPVPIRAASSLLLRKESGESDTSSFHSRNESTADANARTQTSALGANIQVNTKAHEWSRGTIHAPNKVTDINANASYFLDDLGRVIHLRGVNVCGHSKLPTSPPGSTHLNTPGFFNHRNVSFLGRPFNLSEADEHFMRIKGWGLTFVRLLVTWEALEHKGPGLYDEDFIDYLVLVLRKAEKHGIKCFVDPHQDTWSRFSGGSGAPGWTFEICNMDITSFQTVGAAHVHNLAEGEPNPHMYWPTNYAKLACSTMFTLFFAGHVLAPDAKYQGVNVGTFMQEKYVQCYTHLARRLKECKAVMGFEFMNEPHYGYIGLKSMLRFDPYTYLHFGNFPNALQSFALGSGMEIEVDYYVKNFIGLTNKSGTRLVNSQKRSAWLNYGECVWKKHGVWDVDATGKPTVLKPNYFTTHPGTSEPLDFYQDFYMPLIRKYAAGIHSVSPDLLIFFEPIPNEDPPTLNEADRVYPNLVYAPHWYDLKALGTKSFDAKVTFDVQGLARGTKNIISGMYFGQAGAEKNYTGQIGNIARMGKTVVGARPILLGEVGIPMDINEKRAYATGDFKTHNQFLDLVIGSMEAHMLNFTLWNYNPGNDNVHGDHWNGEDFSIYSPNASVPASRTVSPVISRSASPVLNERKPKITIPSKLNIVTKQETTPTSPGLTEVPAGPSQSRRGSLTSPISPMDRVPTSPFEITGMTIGEDFLEGDPAHFHHVGGRALDAVIRPYAAKIAGIPVLSRFNLENLVYILEFTTRYDPSAPTASSLLEVGGKTDLRYISEIFVPSFHYKFNELQIVVEVSDGEWKYDQERQSLYWHYDPSFRNFPDSKAEATVLHKLVVKTPMSRGGLEKGSGSNGVLGGIWEFLTQVYE